MVNKPVTEDEEEEARRLKTLAEEKYKESNLESALKFAKRAENLCAELDGVSEMVMAFKILLTAGKSTEVASSPDWYKVLEVEPFCNISTIKKRYKMLALILHPDKNSFVASEEAFKLVGDAFRCLSDKIRRKEYDMKLRIAIQSAATAAVAIESEDTFRTACSECRLMHQFERRYVGHNLMCPNCKKYFIASEVEADNDLDGGRVRIRDGAMDGNEGKRIKDSKRKMSSVNEILERSGRVEKNGREGDGPLEMPIGGRVWEEMTLAEMQLEAKSNKLQRKKKVKLMEKDRETRQDDPKNTKSSIIGTQNASKKRKVLEIVDSRIGDPKKSKDSAIDTHVSSKRSRDSVIETSEADLESSGNLEIEVSPLKKGGSSRNKTQNVKKKKKTMELGIQRHGALKVGEFEIMPVEDSDFYDFDTDRVERSFKQGQVWAIYDDDDGMPRHYGLIDEVVSFNPFELKMSWLDLQNNGAAERIICCEKLGSRICCGKFKVSKKTIIKSVNFFSHIVNCERIAMEIYRIYPKKGSVWALFKEEEALDSNNQNRCYDIVLFLTNYSEMYGLSMVYLEKVDGYKTVFKRREFGPHAVRWFEKDDVQLFSHQIPARKLSSSEAPESSGDCWELDPASLPRDLLTIALE